MTEQRKRLIIFVAITVVVILGIVLAINYYSKSGNNQATSTPPALTPAQLMEQAQKNNVASGTVQPFDAAAEKNRALNAEDLKKMALSFAERFGSYSNQANYGNVVDLKIFMTASMQVWADKYVADLTKKNTDNSVYYGITTIAVSGTVNKFDAKAGTAEILVNTQRRETRGNATGATFSQNILIKFLQENNTWKVDSAEWQK